MFQETIGGRTRRHGTIHPIEHSGREVPGPWSQGRNGEQSLRLIVPVLMKKE